MRWLAVVPAVVTVALIVPALVLSLDAPPAATAFGVPLYSAIAALATAAIGALILWRSPMHAVGLAFAGSALAGSTEKLADQYAELATLRMLGLPGGEWAAWLGSWIWFVQIVLTAVVLPIVFPTGRPLTRRWAFGLVTGALALTALIGTTALRAGPLETAPHVMNPVGVLGPEQARALMPVPLLLLVASIATAIASMTVRYRRSSGIERQQMKWLVYALALFAMTFLGAAFLYLSGRDVGPAAYAVLVAATLVPVAAGLAILRYRLYDIDVLINRTLVYGAVTALLAATYFGAVVLIQALLRPFTAGSELAIAVSTLIVAALFQPVRTRVQSAVDRRFYRARYDAARTLDAFSSRLRNEVELDAVRADLLGAVGDTMRPAHASVWLRERVR